jgi:aspartate/methionine/tyrosine aminotransferase
VDELTERLEREYATGIVPGRFFDAPGYFRIGWALDTDVLRQGLDRLSAALTAAAK